MGLTSASKSSYYVPWIVLDLATVFSLVGWPGKYGEDTSRLDQLSTDAGNCGDIGGRPKLQ